VAQVVERRRVLDDPAATLDSSKPGSVDGACKYPAADVAVVVRGAAANREHKGMIDVRFQGVRLRSALMRAGFVVVEYRRWGWEAPVDDLPTFGLPPARVSHPPAT